MNLKVTQRQGDNFKGVRSGGGEDYLDIYLKKGVQTKEQRVEE